MQNSFLIYDGRKIVVSDDLIPMIKFLEKIEEEILNILKLLSPVRAQMIILFANLETLFCLQIAYKYKTDDNRFIRDKAMDDKETKRFINTYLLDDNNLYYNKNKSKLKKLSSKKIRDLRNMLTHFFSVPETFFLYNQADKSHQKLMAGLEKLGRSDVVGLSPNEFYEILRSAGLLLIKQWNDDYNENQLLFDEKITFVKSIIQNNGAISLSSEEIKSY